MTNPTTVSARVPVDHVQGGHHHDGNHDGMPDGDDDDGSQCPRRCHDEPYAAPQGPLGRPSCATRQFTGQDQGVGSQAGEDQQRAEGQSDRADDEWPGEDVDPEGTRERLRRTGEVGPEDGADRRDPDDEAQVAAAVLGQREVDRGIPRCTVGGRRSAKEEGAEQEHRERPDRGGAHHEDRPDDGQEVAGCQAVAPSGTVRELGHRDGDEGGPEDLEGAAEAGQFGAAADLLGKERADCCPGRQPDAAEDLRPHQRCNGPSLGLLASDHDDAAQAVTDRPVAPRGDVPLCPRRELNARHPL